ncbi:MAG: iron-sulfur cluster assembly scaffold protein [Dehalococcoidales bacterium]|nr:iron-sulfur cluster assembly scaffold protein [Dehalococcoidales bacterium]
MDEAVTKFYRRLLRSDYANVGSLDHPSIFLDSIGEKIQICSQASNNYINLYIDIKNGTVENAMYLCTCDPAANVAVEILCNLIKGKNLEEVQAISENDFYRVLGCPSDELGKKARGLLELLHTGIKRYKETGPGTG